MSRFLAWVTSILLLALVLEALTRLFTSATPLEPDTVLGWKYKPHVALRRTTDGEAWDFRTNSDRLRAPEGYGRGEKSRGTTRVLLLGDSFTIGWGLPEGDTFAAKLEALAAAEGRRIQAIPAGTEGYYTDQECLWLEQNVKSYAPDAVVVCPYANDVVGNALPKYLTYDKPQFNLDASGEATAAPAPVADGRPWLLRASRLLSNVNQIRLAFTSLAEVPASSGGGRLQLDDFVYLRNEPPVLTDGWRATRAIAKRLVAKASEAGVPRVFCAPIPNRFEIHMGDGIAFELRARSAPGSLDFGKVTAKLAEAFHAAGATVIDARQSLAAAASSGGERLYFSQDWHFNRAGAAIYARALYQGLDEAGVLGPAGAALPGPTPLSGAPPAASGPVPTWAYVLAGLWIALTALFRFSYPDESLAGAAVKIALLLALVAGIFAGIQALIGLLPPIARFLLILGIVLAIAIYAVVKTKSRFATIRELFGALVDRGHWYMVPMLVVLLTISVLLVVAQNPIVAPFIYTLF